MEIVYKTDVTPTTDQIIVPDYKKSGIGKRLVEVTKEEMGEEVMILLLSVPTALKYYPKIGFIKEDRGFAILRSK